MSSHPTSPAGMAGRRDPLVGGVVLVAIGLILLAGQFMPDLGRFVVLVVGVSLLGLFVVRRDYGFLVAGGIVTGVGAGIVVASSTTGELSGGGFLLALGSGFVGIWIVGAALRLAENHPWPLVPGLILLTIGAATILGGTALSLVSLWPAVLVVIGLLLVASWFVAERRRT